MALVPISGIPFWLQDIQCASVGESNAFLLISAFHVAFSLVICIQWVSLNDLCLLLMLVPLPEISSSIKSFIFFSPFSWKILNL